MKELERRLIIIPQSEHSCEIETHSPNIGGVVLPTIRVCAFERVLEIQVIDLAGVKHIVVIHQNGNIEVDK
jgi:vacuolar-type H+-ATPase subunit D/Vma8